MQNLLERARRQLRQRQHTLRAGGAHAALPESQRCEELAEVEAALRRMESGTFGRCEACGGAIGFNRLRALPQARLCNTCSSERSLGTARR